MVKFSHPYIIPGKTIALIIWTFFGKVMSLLYNTLSRFIIVFLPKYIQGIKWWTNGRLGQLLFFVSLLLQITFLGSLFWPLWRCEVFNYTHVSLAYELFRDGHCSRVWAFHILFVFWKFSSNISCRQSVCGFHEGIWQNFYEWMCGHNAKKLYK